jgi:hypothetical protein
MEFLTFHNQFVADLSTDNQQHELGPFGVIQRPQFTCQNRLVRSTAEARALALS